MIPADRLVHCSDQLQQEHFTLGTATIAYMCIKRYDHGMKLARTDYKPIDLRNPTDPLASRLIMKIQKYEDG